MTPTRQPGNGLPENLPLLTQVADEPLPDDLPTLTEVVAEAQPESDLETPAAEASTPASLIPDEEMQRLLQRLKAHLENAFAHKLSLKLEQLQRQAVERAVDELKAELPQLLRDALSSPDSHR